MTATWKLSWLVVALSGLVALGAAGLRWTQQNVVIAATNVAFGVTHNFSWEPATGEIRTLGPDPHAVFEIPPASVPLRRLRLEFRGAAQPAGPAYIYPTPVGVPGLILDGSLVKTAEVTERVDGFALEWQLDDARLVRFDFPDEVAGPWQLDRMELASPFIAATNRTFLVAVFAGAFAVAASLLLVLTRFRLVGLACVLTAGLLVAFKVLLAHCMGLAIMAELRHDDRLFLDQGIALAEGRWLGDFTSLTLAKGPVYPMFLALSSQSGLPLPIVQALLHAVACALLVWAVAPWLRRRPLWMVLLFILLLLDPQMLSAQTIGRVQRSAINPSLVLLVLAGVLGIAARAESTWRSRSGWLALSTLIWPVFWHSREEAVWFLPSLVLLLIAAGLLLHHAVPPGRPRWVGLFLLLLPFVGGWAGSRALSWQNQRVYGAPITEDVRDGTFPLAYAAMLRVLPAEPVPGAQVTRAVRHQLYGVSPAFARIRDQMENGVVPSWSRLGWTEDTPPAENELRSGWLQWALRDAAERAGYYADAQTAQAYWGQVAAEINAACDSGQLSATAPRQGMFPRWEADFIGPTWRAWKKACAIVLRFGEFGTFPPVSHGLPEDIQQLGDFIHTAPFLGEPEPRAFVQIRLGLREIYSWLGPLCAVSGLLCTLFLAARAVRSPIARARLAVLLSLWGGIAALTLVVALVDVTSFHALHMIYLGAAVPLLLILGGLGPCLVRLPRSAPESTE